MQVTETDTFLFAPLGMQPGDPFYVLLCCWLAAVGAGLLKTEEILEGVARLRISNDIEFEEETFIDMMRAAKEVKHLQFLQLALSMITFLPALQWHARITYRNKESVDR